MVALGAVTFCVCVPGYADQSERLDLSTQEWRDDLQYLARTLPAKHANVFHYTSKERFEAAVAELDRQLDHLDSDATWAGMMKIVALVGDAHTYLQAPRDNANFPIDFARFGSDYRVVAVTAGMENALSARVIKVHDIPVARACDIVYQMFSQDENPSLADAFLANRLTIGGQLHGAGIIPDRNTAQYTLAGEDGKEFTIQVHAQAPGQPGSDFIRASKKRPLSGERSSDRFWCTYLADSKTVFCSVRSMLNLIEPEKEIQKVVEQNKPVKLVIDLRQNSGGDYNEGLRHLVQPIRNLPALNRKGHLFVLVGPNTFSAAMANAAHFRYQTEAILVGRTIGEKPNSYQEPRNFSLPNSHLTVRYSTKLYKFVESGENIIKPDQEIVYTWEDYLAGRDPALEWVLKYAPENSAGK